MNYEKIYNDFVLSRKTRCYYDQNIKYEQHHIIPQSLGGLDHPSNLVWLTRREHMFAHWILAKIHTDSTIFWSLQWFYEEMNPTMKNIFYKMRKRITDQKDYSWMKDEWFRKTQQIRTVETWRNHREKHQRTRSKKVYKSKQSQHMKDVWKDRQQNEKDQSTGRFPSRSVVVAGIKFRSVSEAARAYRITPKTVTHRCQSDSVSFADWKFC